MAKVKADFSKLHPDVVVEIEDVEAAKQAGGDVQSLVKRFGLSCSLPGSFQVKKTLTLNRWDGGQRVE